MEIWIRLGSLLSPSFFAIVAGLSLMSAAILFVSVKRSAAEPEGTLLSNLEPSEYRSSAYLVLAFGWSVIGLVFSFIFGAVGARGPGSPALVVLSLICLLFTLCFLFAAGGTLLNAVTGHQGRVTYWLFWRMRRIDSLIMRFGDLLADGLFRRVWRPRVATGAGIITKTGGQTTTVIASDRKKSKVDEDMERLYRRLTQYKALLTPEQMDKLMEERRMIDELRNMYP